MFEVFATVTYCQVHRYDYRILNMAMLSIYISSDLRGKLNEVSIYVTGMFYEILFVKAISFGTINFDLE